MFSEIFIRRPKFAVVISLFLIISGLVCVYQLPISEYPQISPPTVVVMARYPGASAQVIANTVAAPIESEINGVEDMIYYSSTSLCPADRKRAVPSVCSVKNPWSRMTDPGWIRKQSTNLNTLS